MSESFAELFEESLIGTQMRPGAIVTGTVVQVGNDVVVVNAGLKSEGVIPIEQFMSESGELEVKVGDEVDVALEAVEDGFGVTRLSREKAKRSESWTRLEKAHEAGETVVGRIVDKVKGGFTVDLKDIFLDTIYVSAHKRVISPKSVNQKLYIDAIRRYDVVFGIGPAGTGKTYLAMAMALAALMKNQVTRMVLCRPAVEAGERLGFLIMRKPLA